MDKIDINRVNEDIKAISIGLFDWMEKNEEKVQKLMQFFKDKLNRARLLDLTVVNTLHEKSKFYDKFKAFFEDEEEFNNLLENGLTNEVINIFIKLLKNKNNSNAFSNEIFQRNHNYGYEEFSNENFQENKNYNVYINWDDLPISIKNKYKNEELLLKIGNA